MRHEVEVDEEGVEGVRGAVDVVVVHGHSKMLLSNVLCMRI